MAVALRLVLASLLVIPPATSSSRLSDQELKAYRDRVVAMFQHGYEGYLSHAYPYDELRPLSCDGMDTWGSFSLTLIDALDTLAVMGNHSEFRRVANLIANTANFNRNINVSVFETNIRVVGGLLSGHLLSQRAGMDLEPGWPCSGPLLRLAEDVAQRLLPAFDTRTGMPYGTVNLASGVPPGETSVTCTAGVGTFVLEFATLSRLTGNPAFERVALRALKALWATRSTLGLVGNHIDVQTGRWTAVDAGVGAGVDSYFEYLVKGAIMLQMPELMRMFTEYEAAVRKHIRRDDWHFWVGMSSGQVTIPVFQSLEAFWPGLLALTGDVEGARKTLYNYHQVWRQYGFTPEFYDVVHGKVNPKRDGYPLRPELVESVMYLYQATKDPHLLEIGADILESIEHSAKTECGYASVKRVQDHELEDRMESFFLAETTKYLYLLFTPDHFLHANGSQATLVETASGECLLDTGSYVFNTEAHPIDLAAVHCCSAQKAREDAALHRFQEALDLGQLLVDDRREHFLRLLRTEPGEEEFDWTPEPKPRDRPVHSDASHESVVGPRNSVAQPITQSNDSKPDKIDNGPADTVQGTEPKGSSDDIAGADLTSGLAPQATATVDEPVDKNTPQSDSQGGAGSGSASDGLVSDGIVSIGDDIARADKGSTRRNKGRSMEGTWTKTEPGWNGSGKELVNQEKLEPVSSQANKAEAAGEQLTSAISGNVKNDNSGTRPNNEAPVSAIRDDPLSHSSESNGAKNSQGHETPISIVAVKNLESDESAKPQNDMSPEPPVSVNYEVVSTEVNSHEAHNAGQHLIQEATRDAAAGNAATSYGKVGADSTEVGATEPRIQHTPDTTVMAQEGGSACSGVSEQSSDNHATENCPRKDEILSDGNLGEHDRRDSSAMYKGPPPDPNSNAHTTVAEVHRVDQPVLLDKGVDNQSFSNQTQHHASDSMYDLKINWKSEVEEIDFEAEIKDNVELAGHGEAGPKPRLKEQAHILVSDQVEAAKLWHLLSSNLGEASGTKDMGKIQLKLAPPRPKAKGISTGAGSQQKAHFRLLTCPSQPFTSRLAFRGEMFNVD